LENDPKLSFLDFEFNTNLTLRSLLKDDKLFIDLVQKVVAVNESMGDQQDTYMNVLLYDKVNEQEQVLKYMIKIQIEELERKIPQYFVVPNQGREQYVEHLNEVKKTITQITHQ